MAIAFLIASSLLFRFCIGSCLILNDELILYIIIYRQLV
jgi:hypothetical protein